MKYPNLSPGKASPIRSTTARIPAAGERETGRLRRYRSGSMFRFFRVSIKSLSFSQPLLTVAAPSNFGLVGVPKPLLDQINEQIQLSADEQTSDVVLTSIVIREGEADVAGKRK